MYTPESPDIVLNGRPREAQATSATAGYEALAITAKRFLVKERAGGDVIPEFDLRILHRPRFDVFKSTFERNLFLPALTNLSRSLAPQAMRDLGSQQRTSVQCSEQFIIIDL